MCICAMFLLLFFICFKNQRETHRGQLALTSYTQVQIPSKEKTGNLNYFSLDFVKLEKD